jgi:predicted CXXCH cytochrome family protein
VRAAVLIAAAASGCASPDGGERVVEAHAGAMIALGPDLRQVGFDAPFAVDVRALDDAAAGGTIEWRQRAGPPIEWHAEDDGWRLVGRTPRLAAARPGALPAGIVPFSPATIGEAELEATWRSPGKAPARRTIRVAATARATGLPTVGIGHAVVLAGAGWRLAAAPPDARATLAPRGEVTVLVPDATGRWLLVDAAGRELAVRAGRADEVVLDCGRAGCHAEITARAATSPMTSVLARGLDGALGAYDASCAIACHAVGEPGLDDGGFADVATDDGVALPVHGTPGTWDRLPRTLRRLGGVGCAGCHGPAAIAEPPARWGILRADVCAVCHDAPPRYTRVAEWRAGRMARSDASAGTRDAPCARCHTTAGFLASIGARPPRDGGIPPADAGPVGVACAACHAPHGERADRALVRRLASPPGAGLAAGSPSAVCVPCHDAPASTVAILLGGDAPHRAVPDLCVGCHGTDHSFRAVPARCTGCHGTAPVADAAAAVRGRARALADRLGIPVGGAPPHAAPLPADDTPLGRARRDVRLVLDDPAAGAHNARYATTLLDAAEAALAAP